MAVVTSGISFSAVKSNISAGGGGTPTSLSDAFAKSIDSCFHPTYKGSKDRLTNFKGYNHVEATAALFDITNITFSRGLSVEWGLLQTAEIFITNTGTLSATKTVTGQWKKGSTVKHSETASLTLAGGQSGSILESYTPDTLGMFHYVATSPGDSFLSIPFEVIIPCLVLGTKVTLANGLKKPIEELIIGDILKSEVSPTMPLTNNVEDLYAWESNSLNLIDATAKIISTKLSQPKKTIVINDGLIEASGSHSQIVNRNGIWIIVPMSSVKVGDYLTSHNGALIRIHSVYDNLFPTKVVKLTLESPHTFYANDILTHNFK